MYTTRVPSSDTEDEVSEIGSDGKPNRIERTICMDKDNNEYIYRLRVERADTNRKINSGRSTKVFLLRLGLILLTNRRSMKFGMTTKIGKFESAIIN